MRMSNLTNKNEKDAAKWYALYLCPRIAAEKTNEEEIERIANSNGNAKKRGITAEWIMRQLTDSKSKFSKLVKLERASLAKSAEFYDKDTALAILAKESSNPDNCARERIRATAEYLKNSDNNSGKDGQKNASDIIAAMNKPTKK